MNRSREGNASAQALPGQLGTRILLVVAATLAILSGLVVGAGSASASAGQNPVNCPSPAPRGTSSFNVDGATITVELRQSKPCVAGWARIFSNNRNARPLAVEFTAWNPGGPSQGQVPNTNWTYEVDGSPGQQVCAGFQAYWVDALGHWNRINWFFAGCFTA